MRKKYSILALFLFVIIFLPSVFAYDNLGSNNTDFTIYDNSRWGASQSYTTYVQTLTDPKNSPIAVDLDNDGIKEIVVLDQYTLKAYQNHTISPIATYQLTSSIQYAQPYAYDVADGGGREIIIIGDDNQIRIFNFTAALGFQNRSQFNMTTSNRPIDEMTVGCRNQTSCMAVYTVISSLGDSLLGATEFKGDSVISHSYNLSAGGFAGGEVGKYCFPLVNAMSVENIDPQNGNDIEFIFTMIRAGNSNDNPWIFALDTGNANNTPRLQLAAEEPENTNFLGGSLDCENNLVGRYISSPMVFDYDGIASNGLEILLATNKDTDEYGLYAYNYQGTQIGAYYIIDLFYASGTHLSNLARGNFYVNTGNYKDVCVAGYDPTNSRVTYLCGSYNVPSALDSCYAESENVPYNISPVYPFASSPAQIHAAFTNNTILTNGNIVSSSVLPSGNVLTSLVTPYGMKPLRCTFTGFSYSSSSQNLSHFDFEFPFRNNATVITDDTEGTGYADIIAVTDTNLYYLDDGIVNNPGYIANVTFNPCPQQTWKINTSYSIVVQARDAENDLVGVNVSVYYGDSNQINFAEVMNVSSGTYVPFSSPPVANKTISTGIIRVSARDASRRNYNTYDVLDFPFSVSTSGLEFGDSTCSYGFSQVTNESTTTVTLPDGSNANNSISNIIQVAEDNTGLSSTLIWLTVMIVSAITIYILMTHPHQKGVQAASPGTAAIVIMLVEVLELIMGVFLGFFSVALIVVIVVLCIIPLALWGKSLISPSR